jgi:hypothetical protein
MSYHLLTLQTTDHEFSDGYYDRRQPERVRRWPRHLRGPRILPFDAPRMLPAWNELARLDSQEIRRTERSCPGETSIP